jgi:hypothetical protein
VLIVILAAISISIMSTRRITANLPSDLLDAAMEVTGKGITETIVEGLSQIQRRRFYERAMALRGKVKLEIDLEETRGRRRH